MNSGPTISERSRKNRDRAVRGGNQAYTLLVQGADNDPFPENNRARIIVGVSGSPGSLQALRHAAGLARMHEAALVPVLAWVPPGGDLADRSHP